ncbi:MAG TPA: hypothetical protein VMU89_22560 [Thermomicrobiaceae bacterium]|nr:hypothetical protein [Thermomicrobiaceae bacterium]
MDRRGSRLVVRHALLLTLVSVGAAILFFLPFWLHAPSIGGVPFDHQGMERVYGMWDGPLYVTAAATLWDLNPDNPAYAWNGAKPTDYAERFPLYPLLIRGLSPVLGYWKGAVAIDVAASTGVTLVLYFLLRLLGSVPSSAFWVALASIFWPPRGFLYRDVAMSDPLFMLGLVGATYCFLRRQYVFAGLLGAVAVASRPNGFEVVAGFGLLALWRIATAPRGERLRQTLGMAGLGLIPLTLLGIYGWHWWHFGDPLASVHASTFVRPEARLFPSLAFFGIGEEGVPYLFLLALAGILELARQRRWELVVLSALFYVPALLVPTDVSRYLLPILPFAFFVAGERIVASVPLRVALLLTLPVIYVYAWETMLAPGYQAPFGPLYSLLR